MALERKEMYFDAVLLEDLSAGLCSLQQGQLEGT